jgi:8-oxo-dGTP diphosphatase
VPLTPLVDATYRTAYRVAYRLMKTYWKVRQPTTHGALVAVWHERRILLVKNSYVPYWSLPGGYLHRGETGAQAAARELAEEVGVKVDPSQLRPSVDIRHPWEGKQDHVEIFELELDHEPTVMADRREVVEAGFYFEERALELNLFPPIRAHIEERRRHRS